MTDVTDVLQQLGQLHLAQKSAVQIEKAEPDYVLDFAVQSSELDPLVAAVCSNFSIRLMLRSRLAPRGILEGHTSTITGVSFGKTDADMVYSCSKDKSVRCWDTRTNKETQVLEAPSNVNAEYLAMDVSHSDKLICAGTEKVNDEAYLLFWDLRKNSVLGCYNECHDDDITQVRFQPGSDQNLASGSADGLVCTFDLSETSEDDALLTTSNAQSDVVRVGWCGEDNSCVYCVTSDNMFYVWEAKEFTIHDVKSITRDIQDCHLTKDQKERKGDQLIAIEDIQSLLGGSTSVQYLVDCIPELTAGVDKSSAVLVGGTHSGDIQLVCHSTSGSRVSTTLNGGHSTTIRCSHWDNKNKTLMTGAEDSLLCLWSTNPDVSFSTSPKGTNKIRSKPSGGGDDKPYGKGRKKK